MCVCMQVHYHARHLGGLYALQGVHVQARACAWSTMHAGMHGSWPLQACLAHVHGKYSKADVDPAAPSLAVAPGPG